MASSDTPAVDLVPTWEFPNLSEEELQEQLSHCCERLESFNKECRAKSLKSSCNLVGVGLFQNLMDLLKFMKERNYYQAQIGDRYWNACEAFKALPK